MFARESPDDQCTIINIVASDCSDVFKRTLVLYVAFTFCRKVSHQLYCVGPGQDHGESFVFIPKFQGTFPKNNCN